MNIVSLVQVNLDLVMPASLITEACLRLVERATSLRSLDLL